MPWVAALWNGTTDEAVRFAEAIAHHCQCQELRRRCPAHEMMLNQKTIDHLLFLRWWHQHTEQGRISCKSEQDLPG